MKLVASFILLFLMQKGFAEDFSRITSYSIGMVNVNVTENESSLVSTDDSETEEIEETPSAVSAISFNFNYEFIFEQQRSFFVKATVPMMTTEGAGAYVGGLGFNWYLNDLGTKYSINIGGSEIVMVPKFRYWWGASGSIGYLVYNTESAKKSDVFFDIGIHAGVGYNLGEKWGLRSEATIGKGTGVNTSTMNMSLLVGLTYFI